MGRSSSTQDRAEELNKMFESNDIDAIICAAGGEFLVEILPYIDAKKNEAAESEKIVEVPNIEGITIEEARKILKDSGLDINIEKDESLNEKETIIKEQLPKKGIKLKAGSKVIISY